MVINSIKREKYFEIDIISKRFSCNYLVLISLFRHKIIFLESKF